MHHINPDHYLNVDGIRLWTAERSERAWASAYAGFEAALTARNGNATVYLVCGMQGAGKTTWVENRPDNDNEIYFDAALPAREHRMPLIQLARGNCKKLVSVWIDTPISMAKQRNKSRRADHVVPESSLVAVAERFEPPSTSEGFDTCFRITKL
ncbi:MAG: hypothetical protein ACRBB0_24785 [Pelagimonas sp.]|uniref:hypothetical protein n=1 Tax=Pelagimonas sp. TaxID=2073170 RepID=UPI003D6B8A89